MNITIALHFHQCMILLDFYNSSNLISVKWYVFLSVWAAIINYHVWVASKQQEFIFGSSKQISYAL